MVLPGATPPAFTLLAVAGLGGCKPGDVGGSRVAAFELKETFYPCPEVPHPLGEPRVLWISTMSLGTRAALIGSMVNGMGKFEDRSVKLLSSHVRGM